MAVRADPEHLRPGLLEHAEVVAVRAELARAHVREVEHVPAEDDRAYAQLLGEGDLLPLIARHREVRSGLTDLGGGHAGGNSGFALTLLRLARSSDGGRHLLVPGAQFAGLDLSMKQLRLSMGVVQAAC